MKLLLALLALPIVIVTASQDKLIQLANAGNGVIKLDASTFDLITSPTRTWSASVLLTALDARRRCLPCKEFDPSFKAVGEAWATVPKEHRENHFFATLDFEDGQMVFQKLGLQSAPVVFAYPAAEGPRAAATGKASPSKYDFSQGFDAGPLAESLSKHTPIVIPYQDPIDWAHYFMVATVVLGLSLTLRFISPLLKSRWTWAITTIGVSLVMISGYMFTRIRGSPFTGGDGNWIAAGYQNQFGQEVSVVAFIYGLLSSAVLMLILVVPYQKSPERQRLQIYLWTGIFLIVYSILISLFRVKNRGYPFRLFF